jgi:hypothetical protein
VAVLLAVVVILVIAGIYFGSRGGGRRDGYDAAGGYYGPYGDGRDHGHDGHDILTITFGCGPRAL